MNTFMGKAAEIVVGMFLCLLAVNFGIDFFVHDPLVALVYKAVLNTLFLLIGYVCVRNAWRSRHG